MHTKDPAVIHTTAEKAALVAADATAIHIKVCSAIDTYTAASSIRCSIFGNVTAIHIENAVCGVRAADMHATLIEAADCPTIHHQAASFTHINTTQLRVNTLCTELNFAVTHTVTKNQA